MSKKPLDLKKANIHRPTGPKHRGRFELRDGKRVVGRSDHSTSSDNSINGSANDIVKQARRLGRTIRLRPGLVIDPSDEDDDEEHGIIIGWWRKK